MTGPVCLQRNLVQPQKANDESEFLRKLAREQQEDISDDSIRRKEEEIMKLAATYQKDGKAKELANLIKMIRPFLTLISKAKAAKLVRSLVDFFLGKFRAIIEVFL